MYAINIEGESDPVALSDRSGSPFCFVCYHVLLIPSGFCVSYLNYLKMVMFDSSTNCVEAFKNSIKETIYHRKKLVQENNQADEDYALEQKGQVHTIRIATMLQSSGEWWPSTTLNLGAFTVACPTVARHSGRKQSCPSLVISFGGDSNESKECRVKHKS